MNTQKGVTLIELMMVLAVLAIIATIAVPGMNNFLDTNKLRGTTNQFYTDVQFARSESIKRKTNVSVSITSNGGTDWCYGIAETAGCDCTISDTTDPSACTLTVSGTNVLKVGSSTDFPNVSLTSHNGTNQIYATFNSIRGIATSTGTVIFTSANELETHVDVSVLGKVSSCSPAGDHSVAGYTPC